MYSQGAVTIEEYREKSAKLYGTGEALSMLSVNMRKSALKVRFKPSVKCKIMLDNNEISKAILQKAEMILDLQTEVEYTTDLKHNELLNTRELWRAKEIAYMTEEARRQLEAEEVDSTGKVEPIERQSAKGEFGSYSLGEQLTPRLQLLEYIRTRENLDVSEPIMMMAQVLRPRW